MAAHTKNDLYQMQSLPLDEKIRMTARRIDAFIDRNDAYLSISGGKDSRVLDDIERRFVRAKLPRVFIDTGLEHRSVRACGKKHADIILRPEKNFKQIITEYGYPVISKEVAQTIAEARKGLKNGNCYTYRMAKLNGTAVDKNGDKSKYNIPQYKFLLDAPFRISHKCCDYMKKKPAKQYEKETGRLPIVATMAEESNLRLQKWLKHGCNAFDLKRPMSAPMSFWSETDGALQGKRWNCSKNLVRPEPEYHIISDREYFKKEPKAIKGYYVDKNSVSMGVHSPEYYGYGYLRYTLVKITDRGG